MSQCDWPRGCFEEADGQGYCYYHLKVVGGLITPDWYLLSSTTGKPRPERRLQLARTLANAGANTDIVAASTSIEMFPRHYSRHGNGYIRSGRLIGVHL